MEVFKAHKTRNAFLYNYVILCAATNEAQLIFQKQDYKGNILSFKNAVVRHKTALPLETKLHQNDVTDDMHLLFIT